MPDSPPSRSRLLAASALLLAAILVPAGQVAAEETTFFAKPFKIHVMRADPWMGGLWIGTQGGLFYRDVPADLPNHYSIANGLSHSVVNDIAVAAGEVWVATPFGVTVLDKATGEFRPILLEDGTPFLRPTRTLLLDEGEGWIGTDGAGLYKVDYATSTAVEVPNPTGDGWSGPIWGLSASGPDLYISIPGYGLIRWDRAKDEATKHTFVALQQKPYYLRVLATAQDVWVGTDGDGVVRFDPSDGSQTEYASPTTTNSLSVYELAEVGTQVWFAVNGGVTRYDRASESWRTWGHTNPTGVNANSLALLEGVLYAGSASGKVHAFDESSQTWRQLPWWPSGLTVANNVVQSCEVVGDHLLFGTGGGGANRFYPKTGAWEIVGSHEVPNRFPDIGVFATATTADRTYFAIGRGVVEMDPQGGYVTYRTDGLTGGQQNGAPNIVRDIAIDGQYAWFADIPAIASKRYTTDPDRWTPGGVTRMDRQTRDMAIYSTQAGLSNANVTVLAVDSKLVWVGTNSGLDVIDKATGQITNVRLGPVGDILPRVDGVWVAAVEDGLLRYDRDTLQEIGQVPLPTDAPAWKLLEDRGTLWVGTAYHGLYEYDLVNGTFEWHSSGLPRDFHANCMAILDGILYLGSNWGVDRFDLSLRRFLPQFGLADSLPAKSGAYSIQIGLPARDAVIPLGQPVQASGSAVAPEGASVQVRIGGEPWRNATGVDAWAASLQPPATMEGATEVSARLVANGTVLVQTARPISIGTEQDRSPWAIAARAAIRHDPVRDVYVGEPLRFRVEGLAGLPHPRATIDLARTGSTVTEHILLSDQGEGVFLGAASPMAQAGTATYVLRVQWDNGSLTLPALTDGFGRDYSVLVRPLTSQATAFFGGETSFELPTGEPATIEVLVQNTGTRLSSFNLTWSGIAAGWVTSAPSDIVLGPASSATVTFELTVPAGQKAGRYALDLRLAPPASEGLGASTRLNLLVGGASLADEPKGAPAAPWLALAALAGALALAQRRT